MSARPAEDQLWKPAWLIQFVCNVCSRMASPLAQWPLMIFQRPIRPWTTGMAKKNQAPFANLLGSKQRPCNDLFCCGIRNSQLLTMEEETLCRSEFAAARPSTSPQFMRSIKQRLQCRSQLSTFKLDRVPLRGKFAAFSHLCPIVKTRNCWPWEALSHDACHHFGGLQN
jgi:hypothetical protein